ncbi:hypothetical protein PIN31115_02077 [Pandoraea iniqua]|uniref:Uncharacterized protein n=1 Tax=Pandoraea iniqua TaxID=2508288 RepID=A0A5E4UKA3_9BURK|nr:hypothetical protein [Pandoraea iniqua]VVE00471.1 hypothetical protein PIN31115_02077 [Pandoraea iniqua]
MRQQLPFQPNGSNTVNAAVGTTSTPIPLPNIPAQGCTIRLQNFGTQLVQFSFTGAATTNSVPMLPNSTEVFSINQGQTLQAIAPAAGSTLYATLGDGM